MSVVSNASPLIALAQIGQLDLLHHLFGQIIVPPAVVIEVAPSLPDLPRWVQQGDLSQPIGARILSASLGAGESAAISMALEQSADRLLIDERAGRRLAEVLGLRVTGTLGILILSKRRGYVQEVKSLLDALLGHDFRVSEELYELVVPNGKRGWVRSRVV